MRPTTEASNGARDARTAAIATYAAVSATGRQAVPPAARATP